MGIKNSVEVTMVFDYAKIQDFFMSSIWINQISPIIRSTKCLAFKVESDELIREGLEA